MANIQTQMQQFHEAIKLKRFEENKTLREKRDIVLERLKSGLNKLFGSETPPSYEYFNQGSYEMGTGIKPLDSDYDIDVGLHFNISKEDYPDPVEIKKWVYDSLENHTKKVEIRRPCVTVFYQKEGEPIYHVDLAIYVNGNNDTMYLAKGHRESAKEHQIWEEADPHGLSDLIKNRFEDSEDAKQFRRTIRYLKRWKDIKFSSDGHAAPIGIGITVAAYEWFILKSSITDSFSSKKEYDDLEALGCFVRAMICRFQPKCVEGTWYDRLAVQLPVVPHSDLFEKMGDCQMTSFKEKLEKLSEAIQEAQEKVDPIEACKLLQEQFGDDFPIPSPSSTGKKRSPAIISSSSSA
ncbi:MULTISPECIES: nucleotidyltransferase [Spirulina sp. CCY15215]|uniref:nucleotidyltransferase domain-containing protein n=1 Tax=Spirulina sp. CCY15215 TaxID=2767591 RepID=UPI00194E4E6E|nr:nucleotidyltransferase [Spirulina major]